MYAVMTNCRKMHGVAYVNFTGRLERNPSHLALTGEKHLAIVCVAAWCYSSNAIYRAIMFRAVRACVLVSFRALSPADS